VKIKVLSISIISLFVLVGLSGCEDLEEVNYVTVTVNCDVEVLYSYNPESGSVSPAEDLLINIEIIKAGGERVSKNILTDYKGDCRTVTGTFKLYKEQPITCIANVVYDSKLELYPDIVFNSQSKTIEWNEIYPKTDFGGSTSRNIQLTIFGYSEN